MDQPSSTIGKSFCPQLRSSSDLHCLGLLGGLGSAAGAPWSPPRGAAALGAAAAALGLVAAAAAPGPAAAALADLAALGGGAADSAGAFIPGLVGDDPLREGFVSALLLIFFSEIGDKTFFIALLLALQQPRGLVFGGTFGALAVMSVVSVGLGRALHAVDELLPASGLPWDDLLAVGLLLWFGVSTLRDADGANEAAEEEKEEARVAVDAFGSGAAALGLVASTFSLVFAAEWGDKSFLATIALAAASSPLGVVLGAVAGHGLATAIAVLGGSFLGRYIDERVAKLIGGSLFLVFAAATIFDIATGQH
eukprot:scaffold12.g8148.t1